jgi:pimeloyl-ACP methyl ester carboxylesterase
VKHAVVVGHSTGGLVTTALAEQRRDLVTALALIDIGPRLDTFISSGPVGRLLSVPVVGELLWRFRTDSIIRKGLSTAFSRRGYKIPQQLRIRVAPRKQRRAHEFGIWPVALHGWASWRPIVVAAP